jgi:hypothetical protein
MEEFTSGFVNSFICMCPEIVALGLEKICGKLFATIAVIISES